MLDVVRTCAASGLVALLKRPSESDTKTIGALESKRALPMAIAGWRSCGAGNPAEQPERIVAAKPATSVEPENRYAVNGREEAATNSA